MKASEFVFDYVHLLHYKRHKINRNRGGSYIDPPDWIKNKKAIINPFNTKDKCFQYAVTVTLNYEEIKKDPQRIKKIKPFISKYNQERIDFISQKDDWKKFERNNVTIALNVLYATKEKIYPAYVSKNKTNREKQVICNDFKRPKMTLSCSKTTSIIKRNNFETSWYFFCLKCLHSFATTKKIELHKKVCENKDFCNVIIPSADTNILQFNQYQKSDKTASNNQEILNVNIKD